VMRAISLGVSVQRALGDMARRIDSADLDMVVTAINVQYETGATWRRRWRPSARPVRGRIQLLREIQVLTAQQRMTGYVLAVLPFVVGFLLFLINRDYILRLFQPGWIGCCRRGHRADDHRYLIIRKIVDIEV